MRLSFALLVLVSALPGCASPEDAARDRLRDRLRQPTALTHPELNQLIAETLAATGDRPLAIREAGAGRTLDQKDRANVLVVLSGSLPTSDGGLRAVDGRTLRGIEGPATPAHAEIDASQTLWVDVDTFLPQRFELAYSLPGFGDYAYDFSW